MVHHTLALCKGELAEQEEALARCGGDPVRIAAPSIEEGRLRRPRRLLGEIDKLVFDFKGAKRFKFLQCANVGHDSLLVRWLVWTPSSQEQPRPVILATERCASNFEI
jgi:hypothetical protein